MIYNFNETDEYEIDSTWKDIKKRIKIILYEKKKSRNEKIIEICSLLEFYREKYLFKDSDKQ